MKRAVVITALSGLTCAGFGLALQTYNPALSAELDGFSINTQDKAVTITLFTDQRVPYTTEHQGKQYTIVLPNTQLSETQINNGLPVVIDNKNRFIGRAVPTEDGKVKIILPNLPASDYAVSIQQKHGAQASTTVAAEPVPSIKPRPAITQPANNRFEKVAANFPKPAAHAAHTANPDTSAGPSADASDHISLKLSPSPGMLANSTGPGNGAIWNPYVVKVPAVPSAGNSTYSHYHPVRKATAAANPITSGMSTISVADSLNASNANEYTPPASSTGPAQNAPHAGNDPLWYLHSLPPASASSLPPADSLAGPALQDAPAATQQAKTAEHAATPARSLSATLKDVIASIPKWLLITLALFLGGIGIFTLIGGLVLLRILFSQTRQQFMPQAMLAYPQGMPMYAPLPEASAGTATEKSAYASKPAAPAPVVFQDKSSFNALDYMKKNPGNVRQAVQNTVLVKFPSRQRQRGGAKRPASRQVSNAPIYSYHP